jgi:two-component system NtrC family response regulator
MPLELQVKVLRLIEDGEIEKVGAASSTKIDIRIIAATHRSLPDMVENDTFREDLYYRLYVIPLRLPSLRQRPEDIPELVQFFYQRSCNKYGRKDLKLPEHVLARFSAYPWPGNIRELENTIERIVVLARGSEISLDDLPEFLHSEPTPLEVISLDLPSKGISLGGLEKEILLQALQKCDWNQSQAARYLCLSRKTLVYRMHKYDLAERKPSCVTPDRPTLADQRSQSDRAIQQVL